MTSKKKPKRNANPPPEDAGDDDAALFRRLMGDAKPLDDDRAPPHRRHRRPRAAFSRREHRDVLRESLEDDPERANAGGGEHLQFRRSSVSLRTMRRLSRGDYSVQGEIDLHGMTGAEARLALGRFITDCVDRGLTCVRVVHGKGRGSGFGGPVLKPLVDQWLRRWAPVLAFVTARPVDGGTGAIYVLLRRDP